MLNKQCAGFDVFFSEVDPFEKYLIYMFEWAILKNEILQCYSPQYFNHLVEEIQNFVCLHLWLVFIHLIFGTLV